MDLGRVVIGFLKIIPGGVLMFFPSYTVLQNCLDFWKSNKQGRMRKRHPGASAGCDLGDTSLWNKMLSIKAAVIEPQNPALFPEVIREYQSRIRAPGRRGCILFAVCRGKVDTSADPQTSLFSY